MHDDLIQHLFTEPDDGAGVIAAGEECVAAVLIVEDDPQVLALAESVLQEFGYKTISAATVAEAQAIIHSGQEFDLLFTDIDLNDQREGGVTVGEVLEQCRKDVPVLYTSGRGLTDGMQALFVDRSSFLPKPYRAQQLAEAVADLLSSPS
jgi:DNA-binding NtrC family response regulator